jgi:hypothetical protein
MDAKPVAFGAAIAMLASAPAMADDDVGPLVQVSEESPFGPLEACGNFPGEFFGIGVNFVDSEVEPWVEVNPTDSDNIAAFWQQDRWSNGGARSNVAGVSLDGGATFETVVVPGLSDCSGGEFERATDPWLSFSPNGVLHQISLVFDQDPPEPDPLALGGRNGIAVSRSFDGGLNWTDPILVIDDTDPLLFNDKQSITADPTDSDFVYAVWDRLENLGLGEFDFRGPGLFARSTDGGLSWEEAREVFDPGTSNQIIGAQIVVLPNGRLLNFFNQIINFLPDGSLNPVPFTLAFQRSRDKGVTFAPTERGIRVDDMLALGVLTPDLEAPVRDAAILFDVAVDPRSGRVYAVWQDSRFSGGAFDEVAFAMSRDGGRSWSETIKVSQTPADPVSPLRQQAFIPSVAVAQDGRVGVSYYDFRNDVDGAPELADHFLVRCQSRCADAANWGDEVRLTDEPFDYLQAPTAGGLFLGDYVGLTATKRHLLAFFQQSFTEDPASGFFRSARTRPLGTGDRASAETSDTAH